MKAIKIVLVEACQLVNLINNGAVEKRKENKIAKPLLLFIALAIINELKVPRIDRVEVITKIDLNISKPNTWKIAAKTTGKPAAYEKG
tara:strand:+ start:453 stop:716 length:264 start_codon:yes stop_codon:yes gene_type:complete